MTDNVVKGRFARTEESVGPIDEEIDALMKRHGVTAYVFVAECERKLYSSSSFHGATHEDDQRAQFMLSAVCSLKAEQLREGCYRYIYDGELMVYYEVKEVELDKKIELD